MYIAPRSVQRLEEELEALEKAHREGLEVVEGTDEIEEQEQKEAPASQSEDPPASNKEEETWKKRHGDLRRLSQKQAEDLKKAEKRLADLEKEKRSVDLPSPEEAAEWAKTNPKAAAIIRALASEASPSNDVEEIRRELAKNKQEVAIKKLHPDFDEITASDEFHDWAESQTRSVQNLIYDGDVDDVIWAINLYKKELVKAENPNKAAAKNVISKSSNAPVDDNSKKKFSESQVQKMPLHEYEKHEDAIKEAMKNGTFVYDLSGGAR